jgi:hypothetical protein
VDVGPLADIASMPCLGAAFAAVLHMHLVIMAATITASTAGMTSSFVMIEFDENGGFIRWAGDLTQRTNAEAGRIQYES